jgi:hypothetical protein
MQSFAIIVFRPISIKYKIYKEYNRVIMPPKKKVALTPHKLTSMLDAVVALQKCLSIKCKIEQEKLKKSKYLVEIEKITGEFQNGVKDLQERFKNDKDKREAEFGKKFINYMKKTTELKIKMMKEKERDELIDCQLKNCYEDTLHMLKLSIENMLEAADKTTEQYKLALKYKKIFETTKLKGEDINNLDIDMMKIRLKEYAKGLKAGMKKK